jgi:hypothetical protein
MYYLKRLHIALFRLTMIVFKKIWELFVWALLTLANLWVDQVVWLDKYLTPDAWKAHRKSVMKKNEKATRVDSYETDVLFTKKAHVRMNSNEHGKFVKVKYV